MAKQELVKRRSGRFKTIGPAEIPKPDPSNYLRSHAAFNLHKNLQPGDEENICPGRKPPLPDFRKSKSAEQPKLNIISRNKLLALLSEAKKPLPYVVDTRDGHKYNLIGSGLTNYYVFKDNFGKIPCYLQRRKKEKYESDQLYSAYSQELAVHQQVPRLSSQEREQLLTNLKERHSKLYKDFLCLSVIMDTLHKRQRKAYLEKELNDIEKDIRTVEENELIFVEER
ncbi:hypothetical protein Aperf_G00000087791 [Anoplocephala perfoliata]